MRTLLLVPIVLVLASNATAGEAEKVFEQVRASVLTVSTYDEHKQMEMSGSAVVVGPGKLVTNCHVVEDAAEITVRVEANELVAGVVSGDLKRDLCLLEVKGLTQPAVTLRSSSMLKIGEAVYSVGDPLGFGLAVGNGLVSGVRRLEGETTIFSSAPTSPGSSGGGLFDEEGHLVGITTGTFLGAQNLNTALPAEWITELLQPGSSWKKAAVMEPDTRWLEKAETLRNSGDWSGLETLARRWTRDWPRASIAHTYLGLALFNRTKNQEAREALTVALEMDGQNATAYGYRGIVRRALGDSAGGYEDVRRAQTIDPARAYYYRSLAEMLREDDLAAAVTAVEAALQRDPSDSDSWELLGELRHKQHRYQDAEKAYRAVLKLTPGQPAASQNLAAVLALTGNADAARKLAVSSAPVNTGHVAATWLAIAEAEHGRNSYLEAEKAYRKALELNPELVRGWLGLGHVLQTVGRDQEAEAAQRRAVQLQPDLALGWLALGSLAERRGDQTGARQAFEKATHADPSLGPAWYGLGALQHQAREMVAAAASLERAARLPPEKSEVWALLGDALIRTGQGKQALDALLTAEKLDPKNPSALQGLAHYYGKVAGDHERALVYLDRSLEINAASPHSWSSKGYVLLKLKRYPEAVKALQTATRLQPDFASAWVNLGEAQMRQQQIGNAILALERALELVPGIRDARYYAVQCYSMTGQYKKAQAHLDALFRYASDDAIGLSLQAVLYWQQNMAHEAREVYRRLKSVNPDVAENLRRQFSAAGKDGELSE